MSKKISSNRELREFGFLLTGYFIVFSLLISILHHHAMQLDDHWILLPIFIVAFLLFPQVLLPLNLIWHFILKMAQWINTRIILGIIFFFVFSPIAILRRFLKKDSMNLQINRNIKSYRMNIVDQNDLRRPY